jgi:hypothetical protein
LVKYQLILQRYKLYQLQPIQAPRGLQRGCDTPGKGFGTYPQENIKIITLPLPEALKYLDSIYQNTTLWFAGFEYISRLSALWKF